MIPWASTSISSSQLVRVVDMEAADPTETLEHLRKSRPCFKKDGRWRVNRAEALLVMGLVVLLIIMPSCSSSKTLSTSQLVDNEVAEHRDKPEDIFLTSLLGDDELRLVVATRDKRLPWCGGTLLLVWLIAVLDEDDCSSSSSTSKKLPTMASMMRSLVWGFLVDLNICCCSCCFFLRRTKIVERTTTPSRSSTVTSNMQLSRPCCCCV